jgi:hypothetical protein
MNNIIKMKGKHQKLTNIWQCTTKKSITWHLGAEEVPAIEVA